MTSIVLQPSITAQWYALVKDAEHNSHLNLTEDLESYLVFLLVRFNAKPEIAKSIMGLEFLNAHHLTGRHQHEHLRDVGDKCLLYAGLFPGRAERRRVKVSYFVELGQSAYSALSMLTRQKIAELYASLGEGFVALMDVLHAIRKLTDESAGLTPIQAVELWEDVGSVHALQLLRRHTSAHAIFKNHQVH